MVDENIQRQIYQVLREIGEYTDLEALAVVNREGMKRSLFAKKVLILIY